MKWLKKGLIIRPNMVDWMVTHAAVPFVEARGGDLFRVYFTSRDSENRSQTGFAEFDIKDPANILRITERPILTRGELGAFDDRGAMCSWVIDYNGLKYMYYIGWNLGVSVPFYSFTGLAVSKDNGESFKRISRGYILERDDIDPYIATNPCVLIENGLWRMWYISGVKWVIENDKPKHYYHIKYAESTDGIKWKRKGDVAIDFKSDDEYAIARPFVFKEGGLYKMWYSYRGQSYRIGYAESLDGIKWERKDELMDIDVSESDWDSDMIEYGFIFDHNDNRYMLYNGNDFGRTGIGLAILEK